MGFGQESLTRTVSVLTARRKRYTRSRGGEAVQSDESWEIAPVLQVGGEMVEFEQAPCNRCGSTRETELFRGIDRSHRFPGTFRIVRCLGCGLLRQNPRPTAGTIRAYYPETYEPFSPPVMGERNLLRRLDRWYGMYKRRHIVERYHGRGRVLDVGCATGNFLAEMKHTGRWQVAGLEPSEHAASVARTRNHLDVQVGSLADLGAPPESFDVVTLWNVVEHLHQPIDDLKRAAAALKAGGHLILSLPNLESFEVKLFADCWQGWELPRHLYFFSRETLASTLKDLNFTIVDRINLSGGQISFALSLRNMYADREEVPLWNQVASIIVPSMPARVLLSPTFYVLGRLGHATSVTVIARKV